VIFGIAHKAFPYFTTGRPLGLFGLLPALLIFGAIFILTFRNKVVLDNESFNITGGVFFFQLTRSRIPFNECKGIFIRRSRKNKFSIILDLEKNRFNTLLTGSEKKIEDLASLISEKSGVPILEDNINDNEERKSSLKIGEIKIKKFPKSK